VKRLNILLGAPGTSHVGNGVAAVVASQANKLFEAGHDVTVIGCDPLDAKGLLRPLNGERNSLSIQMFPIASQWNRRVFRAPGLRRWLRTHIHDFDVVDLQGVWSLFAVDIARSCRQAGVPYLLTPQGQMTRWDWGKAPLKKAVFFSLFMRHLWRSAAAIRFVSHHEAALSKVGASVKGLVIPNFVPPPPERDFTPGSAQLRRKLDVPEGAPVILFLGRIDPQKSIVELLEAFELCWQQRPDLVLLIAGNAADTAYEGEVTEKARSLRCRNAIRFAGPLYAEEKEAAFASAALFVTMSKAEGMPIAVLEAMSRGVPVLVTPGSNLPEVAARQAGKVVGCVPAEIAESILGAISDPDGLQQMGVNAKRLFMENFSDAAIMPKLLSLYVEVAARRARTAGAIDNPAIQPEL
jgi:glycosyltransferase involved in cell wall biosynthesis